jgi:histone H4
MHGKGKGAKGLSAMCMKRRQSAPLKNNIKGITRPAIQRLARRGGCKRLSGLVYEETRSALKSFLETIVRDIVCYTEYASRKTVMVSDVLMALRKNGRTLYGFDTVEIRSAPSAPSVAAAKSVARIAGSASHTDDRSPAEPAGLELAE